MPSSIADLVELFPQEKADAVGFAQGVVVEWDLTLHTNLINVHGAEIPNVQYLGVLDTSIDVSSVVGLLRYRSTYFILGRIKEF
jgi:hypothetical protein